MHFDPVGWHATGTLQVGGRGPRVRMLDASNGLRGWWDSKVVSCLAWLTVVLLESLFFCLGRITKSKFQNQMEAAVHLDMGGCQLHQPIWIYLVFVENYLIFPRQMFAIHEVSRAIGGIATVARARTFMQRALYVEQINDDLLRSDLSKQWLESYRVDQCCDIFHHTSQTMAVLSNKVFVQLNIYRWFLKIYPIPSSIHVLHIFTYLLLTISMVKW